ncbi:RbsD/FucU domain-containing protein [Schaalia sp. ZJ1691]|uniref:RbsD/FucU family protein n=1 Tax=Schaalia sp. ZJ1691 TaxID=2709404 RepID=UPI0013EADB5B|nr:RbsD/FucU domain-containing protein [Schaalia sp. ZJ1691]
MLTGIDPLLTGDILKSLDEMGHSDTVAIVDGNFPAERTNSKVIRIPGIGVIPVLKAVLSVLPLDEDHPPILMDSAEESLPPAEKDILQTLGETPHVMVGRWDYYPLVSQASVVIATGETRTWANVILSKGLVQP